MNREVNRNNMSKRKTSCLSIVISFSLIGFSVFIILPMEPLRKVDKKSTVSSKIIQKEEASPEIIVIPRAPVFHSLKEKKSIDAHEKKNNFSQTPLQRRMLSVKKRNNKVKEGQTQFSTGRLLNKNNNESLSENKIGENTLTAAQKKDNSNLKKETSVSIPDGRFLLRILEHGKGPEIFIGWPQNLSDRSRLYHLLRKCYGMKNAVISQKNVLYSEATLPGRTWIPNTDLFSGFLRSPIGQPIKSEDQNFEKIAQRHNLSIWNPVRIFPRNVDAMILSGLRNLIGQKYQKAQIVRAHYMLKGGSFLYLHKITVDRKPVFGEIRIPLNNKLLCAA